MSHPALNPRTGALQAVCICKDRYFLDNQTKICQGMHYKFNTSGLTYEASESSEVASEKPRLLKAPHDSATR